LEEKTQRVSIFNYYPEKGISKKGAAVKMAKPKISSQKNGVAHSFGVNSWKGKNSGQNWDRVTIFFDLVKLPKDGNGDIVQTPLSFFGLYQGFGGSGCASYLRDNFHKFVINSKYFPGNIEKSIKEACIKSDYEFIKSSLSKNSGGSKTEIDESGASGVMFLVLGN
jgi:protein phosphatase 2C family protein 2/3